MSVQSQLNKSDFDEKRRTWIPNQKLLVSQKLEHFKRVLPMKEDSSKNRNLNEKECK